MVQNAIASCAKACREIEAREDLGEREPTSYDVSTDRLDEVLKEGTR